MNVSTTEIINDIEAMASLDLGQLKIRCAKIFDREILDDFEFVNNEIKDPGGRELCQCTKMKMNRICDIFCKYLLGDERRLTNWNKLKMIVQQSEWNVC